jgi:hypothetical protein
MAVNSEWLSLMPSTATYQNITSNNVYGGRIAGTVVSFKCHIKTNRIENTGKDGVLISLSGTVYMDDVYDVQKTALLTLPDGSQPKITNVQTFYDEIGPHHTTIDFEG